MITLRLTIRLPGLFTDEETLSPISIGVYTTFRVFNYTLPLRVGLRL